MQWEYPTGNPNMDAQPSFESFKNPNGIPNGEKEREDNNEMYEWDPTRNMKESYEHATKFM